MVKVKPFRGLRPPSHLAADVSAPPYDVINSDEARELFRVAGEKSFLRVNKPEVDLPPEVNQYYAQVGSLNPFGIRYLLTTGFVRVFEILVS